MYLTKYKMYFTIQYIILFSQHMKKKSNQNILEGKFFWVIVMITILVIILGIVVNTPKAKATLLWESIEKNCKGDPELNPVELPNGNLGFTISCEGK